MTAPFFSSAAPFFFPAARYSFVPLPISDAPFFLFRPGGADSGGGVPLLSRRGAEPRRTEAVLQQGCGRRARWRAGGAAAERGGPADGVAASGSPQCRTPASPHAPCSQVSALHLRRRCLPRRRGADSPSPGSGSRRHRGKSPIR